MLTVVINALVQQEEMVTVIQAFIMCLNSLNSQELECAQLPTVAQTKDLVTNPNSCNQTEG